MQCLYRSDYGPADPAFDPFADGGQLLRGYEARVYELSQAQNRGELEAMTRKLDRGEPIMWCDQGYAWVNQPSVTGFFEIIVPMLILPWVLFRALSRFTRYLSGARSPRLRDPTPSRGA
jgi:hypothetical protein